MFAEHTLNLEDMYNCIYNNSILDDTITITCGKLPFSCPGPRPGTILGFGHCELETEMLSKGLIRKTPTRWLNFIYRDNAAPYTARDVLEFLEYSMDENDIWDVFVEAAVFDWDGSWLRYLTMNSKGTIEPVADSYNTFYIDARWIDIHGSMVNDPSNY